VSIGAPVGSPHHGNLPHGPKMLKAETTGWYTRVNPRQWFKKNHRRGTLSRRAKFFFNSFGKRSSTPTESQGLGAASALLKHMESVFLILLSLKLLWLIYGFKKMNPIHEGDTQVLLNWAAELKTCLDSKDYFNCGQGGHFPLLQYLWAFWLPQLGFDRTQILDFFVDISFFSWWLLLGLGGLFFLILRKPFEALLYLLILGTAPFIPYSHSSFGEMNAAFWCLLFAIGCMKKWPVFLLLPLSLIIGATKDIVAPLVFVVGLAAYGPDLNSKYLIKPQYLLNLFFCGLFSFITGVLFNLLRYGVWYNKLNLDPKLIVSDIRDYGSFLAGLLVAPNGGIIWFWFSLSLLMLYGLLAWVKSLRHQGGPLKGSIPYYSVLLCFVAVAIQIVGLAKWWAPFGWHAYGPRLMLPWLPAIALILVQALGSFLKKDLFDLSKYPWKLLILMLAVVFLSVPHFAVNFDLMRLMNSVYVPFGRCPQWPDIHTDIPYYYLCMWVRMWEPQSWIHLESWRVGLSAQNLVPTMSFVLWIMLMFSKLRSLGGFR
jgi:hypothetical protein